MSAGAESSLSASRDLAADRQDNNADVNQQEHAASMGVLEDCKAG